MKMLCNRAVLGLSLAVGLLLAGGCTDTTSDAGIRVSPDEETTIVSDGGEVEITIPAGAVAEDGTVRVTVSTTTPDPPEGAKDAIVVLEVTGVDELYEPARLAFSLPSPTSTLDMPVQVFHRKTVDSPWTILPSWYEGGQVVSHAMGFSTFLVAVADVPSQSIRHEVPNYSLDEHAIHFGNDTWTSESVIRDFSFAGGLFQERANGLCFGMAATSFDYFVAGRRVPAGRLAVTEVGLFGVDGFTNTGNYHSDALASYVLGRQSDQLGQNLSFLFSFRNLRDRARINLSHAHHVFSSIMQNARPVIVSMTSDTLFSGGADGHAVLAYSATRTYDASTDTLVYVFDVYDPNAYRYRYTDPPSHWHGRSHVRVQVENYESSRASGGTFSMTAQLGLSEPSEHPDPPAPRSLLNIMAYNPAGKSASPWSNPTLHDVAISVSGPELTIVPSWSHPNARGDIAEVAWMITSGSGHVVADGQTPANATDTYIVDISGLTHGEFGLHTMVRDAQGNLSNVASAVFRLSDPGGTLPGALVDDFDDRDYTHDPTWTLVVAGNKDDNPAVNYVDVSSQFARFVSTNHGGRGGSVGLRIDVAIPVDSDTTVRFDALATFRDVGNGCGWTCREYPANVLLHLEDATGTAYRVIYGVNYGGAVQDQSGEDWRIITTSVAQGVWARDLSFRVRDAWPHAVRITAVQIHGSGWNFDGGIDNIAIGR